MRGRIVPGQGRARQPRIRAGSGSRPTTVGPYCSHREDQFGVHFEMDVTFKPTGVRQKLVESGLYTVSNDKIVQEEFWYLVD